MMEKNGEIRKGVTPPEDNQEKSASEDALAEHATKRFADEAQEALSKKKPAEQK